MILLTFLVLFISINSSSTSSCSSCQAGESCYPGIGCVALGSHRLDCHGVCIDTKETPTLQCSSILCPSGEPGRVCPLIWDLDQCYKPPVIHRDGSCARRGAPLKCADGEKCLPVTGCPSPLPTSITQQQEEAPSSPPPPSNNNQTGMIAFFFVFGILVVTVFFAIVLYLNWN